jgi:hypothetical protein
VKAIDHREAGLLVFDATLLPLPEHPGYHLVLHNARPGTGTAERLAGLMAADGAGGAAGGPSLVVPHPG